MSKGIPETVSAVSTTEYGADDYQVFDVSEPVEMRCLCCSTDRFEHIETIETEHGLTGRFECVGCGAISDHSIPRSDYQGATDEQVRDAVEQVEQESESR